MLVPGRWTWASLLAGGLACTLSIAGCFGPDAREGLRCSASGDCPPGQDCFPVAGEPEPGVCASAPPVDGGSADGGVALFGAPELVELDCGSGSCLSPRDPSLTDDLTQLVFTVESLNAPGDHDVYLARRALPDDPWETAVAAGTIDTLIVEEGSWVSGNGLFLYFGRHDQNVVGPPYGDLYQSSRVAPTDPFDGSGLVPGVANTSHAEERSPVAKADFTDLLFTRALEEDLGDHDVYLAVNRGGQWDSVARVAGVSVAGEDERSLALVEPSGILFVSRGARIIEARWTGDDIAGAQEVIVHDELALLNARRVSGIWASADGNQIWFGSCDKEACAIYRAVR